MEKSEPSREIFKLTVLSLLITIALFTVPVSARISCVTDEKTDKLVCYDADVDEIFYMAPAKDALTAVINRIQAHIREMKDYRFYLNIEEAYDKWVRDTDHGLQTKRSSIASGNESLENAN